MKTYYIRHYDDLNSLGELYPILEKMEKGNKDIQLINKNNKVNFVGILIDKENIIYSFPKKYSLDGLSSYDTQLLFNIVSLNNRTFGLGNRNNNQFPFSDFLDIFNYYTKHGLYLEIEKYNSIQPNGKINWLRMINKSNKIISNNNLIFSPMIYKKGKKSLAFLTECMDFILNDAYQNYLSNINNRFKYKRKYHNNDFSNFNYVISSLYNMLANSFKDSTKKIIINCINYFKWKGAFSNIFTLFTIEFDYYWQKMVHFYLNGTQLLPSYIYNSDNDTIVKKIIFKNNTVKHNFESEKKFRVDSINTSINEIRIDHFLDIDNNVYLLDSKYYLDSGELNYKQCSYYYFLKTISNYKNKRFYTALIYPTSSNNHIELTLNRSHIKNDNLVLGSIYLNIKMVMEYFVYH